MSSEARVYLRVSWGGRNARISTGIIITKDRWEASTGRCVRNSFHGPRKEASHAINNRLQQWEDAVSQAFSKYNYAPNSEQVVSDVRGIINPEAQSDKVQGLTMPQLMYRFKIKEGSRRDWSPGTEKMFGVLESLLTSWKPALKSSALNSDTIAAFSKWLQTQDYKASTANKRLMQFKRVIVWAQKNGYAPPGIIELPSTRTVKTSIVFLTFSELEILEAKEYSRPNKAAVRDMFLFMCYTSLRYSDMQAVTWADIRDGRMQIFSQKTGDFLNIELSSKAQAVLDRLGGERTGYVFPRLSGQKFNDNIKEIAKECDLNRPIHKTWYQGGERRNSVKPLHEVITSHCGRRTFICLSLQLGISPLIIMKWTGHDSYESMKPYIEIVDASRKSAMELWNKL